MNEEALQKIASVLSPEELQAFVSALGSEDLEKQAEEEKLAELEAEYAMGEYTAASFVDELEKIAKEVDESDDSEFDKVASEYETFGRQMAREYFDSLVKQAEEELEEDRSEEKPKEEKEDEKEDKSEDKEEDKEKGSVPPFDKMKAAKEKLMAAVAAKKAE